MWQTLLSWLSRGAVVLRTFDTTQPGVETRDPGDPRPEIQSSAAIGLDGTIYIERATLPNQRIAPFACVGSDEAAYFSMALVRPPRARNRGE